MRAGVRKAILFAVLLGIVGWLALDSGRLETPSPGAAKRDGGKETVAGAQDSAQDTRAGRYALPERAPLGETRAEIFGPHTWQPPAPKVTAAPAAPRAPAMPYRFAGKLLQEGKLQVFLAKGDEVVSVREGDTLDGTYRVQAIDETQITLVYLPLGLKETIPVSSSLPIESAQTTPAAAPVPAAPGAGRRAATELKTLGKTAQLLWEGPQNVKMGTQFSVALRVTSQEPVSASPMQFKFDPSVLESVAVKPGRFFAHGERKFSYRVNPEGSIFIGASNPDQTPATDAEFLVLTFKPLKPAPVAELSVASLNLQGPAGRAIAFDPLASFKTAITP